MKQMAAPVKCSECFSTPQRFEECPQGSAVVSKSFKVHAQTFEERRNSDVSS